MSSVNVKRVPAAGCSKIFKSNLERSHGSLFQSPPLLQVRPALKCESGCKSDIFERLKAALLAEVPACSARADSSVIACDSHHLLTGDYNMEACRD